jgi:hypothetical protein
MRLKKLEDKSFWQKEMDIVREESHSQTQTIIVLMKKEKVLKK